MSIYLLKSVFLQEEIDYINNALISSRYIDDPVLGRSRIEFKTITNEFRNSLIKKVSDIVYGLTGQDLVCNGFSAVRYSNKNGSPNLPPHYDRDKNDLIFNFQLSSNISWGVGVGLKVYELEDNSAAIFNPNTNIHWRPHKTFKDDEYVTMIFFRFYKKENQLDYSYLPDSPSDLEIKEVANFRDSL
jgi:hypothetical protein